MPIRYGSAARSMNFSQVVIVGDINEVLSQTVHEGYRYDNIVYK